MKPYRTTDFLWEGFYDIRKEWNSYVSVVRLALRLEWTTVEGLKNEHKILVRRLNDEL